MSVITVMLGRKRLSFEQTGVVAAFTGEGLAEEWPSVSPAAGRLRSKARRWRLKTILASRWKKYSRASLHS